MMSARTARKATRISVEGFAMAVLFFLLFESFYPRPEVALKSSGTWATRTENDAEHRIAVGTLAHLHHLLAHAGHRALTTPLARLAGATSPLVLSSVYDSESGTICTTCNASSPGDFASSPYFTGAPLLERAEARTVFAQPGQAGGKALLRRFLVHHIPFAAAVSKAWMRDSAQNAMLNSFLAAPDMLLSYNFTGLSLDKPTAYIYTRTGGKKLDNGRRLAYFQMHHDTIHAFQDKIAREGYADGTQAKDRQLLYIVVRDDSEIDTEVDAFFRARSIRELDSQATPRQYAVADVCLSVLEHSSLVISLPLFRRGPDERSRYSTMERRRASSGGRQG